MRRSGLRRPGRPLRGGREAPHLLPCGRAARPPSRPSRAPPRTSARSPFARRLPAARRRDSSASAPQLAPRAAARRRMAGGEGGRHRAPLSPRNPASVRPAAQRIGGAGSAGPGGAGGVAPSPPLALVVPAVVGPIGPEETSGRVEGGVYHRRLASLPIPALPPDGVQHHALPRGSASEPSAPRPDPAIIAPARSPASRPPRSPSTPHPVPEVKHPEKVQTAPTVTVGTGNCELIVTRGLPLPKRRAPGLGAVSTGREQQLLQQKGKTPTRLCLPALQKVRLCLLPSLLQ